MMGKNMAPAAVFEMNSVTKVPTRQTAVITTMGLVPQTSRIPLASHSAMPVFWIARPRTALPAKTMSISQLMARMACSMLQQRQMSMAAAARKAHCSRGMMPKAERATIASMMRAETMVPLPMLGTSSESKKCRAPFSEGVSTLRCFGQTSSSVSPTCSTTSRGAMLMRSPRRATAASITSLSRSNEVVPMALPIRLLPKSTCAVRNLRLISTSLMEKM